MDNKPEQNSVRAQNDCQSDTRSNHNSSSGGRGDRLPSDTSDSVTDSGDTNSTEESKGQADKKTPVKNSTEESKGQADKKNPEKNSTEESKGQAAKKKADDFIFGKMIGEGSYSNVFLAKEVKTGNEYAIKVLNKRHIMREKKTKYVMRERDVFAKINHPFFVKLYFTFQDADRLFFGLTYARRGELLKYIEKLGCFDINCTRFYAAEIVLALEHLHSLGIIHRDLKPENILLNDDMHIQITDFGSAKILGQPEGESNSQEPQRRSSFVGTAQYVTPEVLTSKRAYTSSDLWALGVILYQLVSGKHPFWGGHEYQIFQKVMKLDYEFPEGFDPLAKDLVQKLLVEDPTKRLGCPEMDGYPPLKAHKFFEGVNWDNLVNEKPPELMPYLPAQGDCENLWSQYKPGLDEAHIARAISDDITKPEDEKWIAEEERKRLLQQQATNNNYHRFVENNLVLKQGLIDKRVGLFARRRMFLLTEGPHLYYVDPQNMVLKGQIPWSKDLRPEAKNFKIFFVHTPNRTYYLEDPSGNSLKWCKKIQEVYDHYYEDSKP